MDKIKRKIAIYKTILGITMGSAIYGGLVLHDYNDNVEHLAEVPSTLRYELYYNGTLEEGLLPLFQPGQPKVDRNITLEVLDNLRHTSIDLKSIADISYVLKCHNLSSISVFNSECLTKKQLDILVNSSADIITLYYDNPSLHKEDKLDLDIFKDKKEVIIRFYPQEEVEALTLNNYLVNKNNSNITLEYLGNVTNRDIVDQMDIKLDEIVASLDLKESDNEYDKLMKIIQYVNNKIEYDQMIANYLENKSANIDDYLKMSNYYNNNDISSIIYSDHDDTNGVCINYANLLDILCYKAGIKCRTVSGVSSKCGHAWNMLYLDNNKSYVDLTGIDTYQINEYLKEYLTATDSKIKKELKTKLDHIIFQGLDTHKAYALDKSNDALDSNPLIIEVNYNQGLEGRDILNTEIPHKKYLLIGYGAAILLIGSWELVKNLAMYMYNEQYEKELACYDPESVKKELKR